MNYIMTTPCNMCPFLEKFRESFDIKRLEAFASGPFPCHKTAECQDADDFGEGGGFMATPESQHCAGALIFHEKRGTSHNMMRICERLRLYDHKKLNVDAPVRME